MPRQLLAAAQQSPDPRPDLPGTGLPGPDPVPGPPPRVSGGHATGGFTWTVACVAGLVTVLGLVEMLAWWGHWQGVLRIRAQYAPVRFNAALALAVVGAGLVSAASGRVGWLRAAGAACSTLGAATLAQRVSGRDLGFDEVFVRDYLAARTENPGGLAASTALCLVVIGVAFLIWHPGAGGWRGRALTVAAGGVSGFVLVATLHYLVDAPPAGWDGGARMALPTAMALSLTCLAMVALHWQARARRDRPPTAWIAVPCGMALFMTVLLLWQAVIGVRPHATVPALSAALAVLAIAVLAGALLAVAVALGQRSNARRVVAESLAARLDEEVSRRTKAEAAARDSERLMFRFFDALPMGVAIFTPDRRPYFANRAAEEFNGRGPGRQGTGLGGLKAMFDTDEAGAAGGTPPSHPGSVLDLALAGEHGHAACRDFHRPDGDVVATEQWAAPVLDDTGQVGFAVVGFVDITARRVDEFMLAQQGALLDLAPEAIFILDGDRRVSYWNRGAEICFGWTREEALGRVGYDLLRSEFPDRLGVETALRRDGHWEGELVKHTRAGARIVTDTRLVGGYLPDGSRGPILVIDSDITVRRAAETALRVSEEKLRLLVNNTPDYAIFMLDPHGRIETWNAGAQRVKGFTEAEALGRHFSLLYTGEDRAAGQPLRGLAEARAHGRHQGQGWRVRKDGSRFWADVVITAVRDEGGGLRGFSKVTRDLTERRRSETRFEGLVEAAPDALLGVDACGLIQLVNSQAERLFGYPRTELLGRPIETLVPNWDGARHPHHRTGCSTDAQVSPLDTAADVSGRRKDGTGFPVEISLSSIETEDGLLVTASVRDVTDRRAFEAVVAAARDLAEHAARSRQEFLANMSHEIRTPMNAVIGMTSLLLDTTVDHQQRDYLETVRTSGEHLLTIINDILDYAKIDAGKLLLEEVAFEVRPWLRDTLELITAQAQDKELELICDVTPETPAAITADPGRLRQILINLLSNAVKFTRSGEVTVRVSLDDGVPDRPRLLITVSDTGAGVDPERIEALFDPFTQADSSTTRLHGGTGLGLAISRRLATAMGGQITLQSTPGAGTTVSLTVPAGTDRCSTATGPAAPAAGPPARGPLAGKRMLIVDDNAANRSVLETWARRYQMACVTAAGAEQALRAVEDDHDFAVAVIDLLMPGTDGIDLAALLKARLPDTRLILLSPAGTHARRLPPAPELVDAVMSKPADQERLFDLLNTVLRTGPVPEQRGAGARVSAFTLPAPVRDLAILIVEDSAVNQKVAQHLLRRFGFRSDVAASGLEAIAALEQRDYDLVLMDIQMPDMDGLEATRLIRARWPLRPLRIVAMTANVAPEDVRRCHDVGMDGFLGKPIAVQALARVLSESGDPASPPPAADAGAAAGR